jgi:uncharacterized protein YbjT (DUF2867 family)
MASHFREATMTTILVTGATGNIGAPLCAALAKRGDVKVRAGVHTKAKAAALPAGVEAVELDWARPATVAAAIAGAERALLLTPVTDQLAQMARAFVDAARAAKLQQIVKISTIGADAKPGVAMGRWHREVEELVEGSGIAWTHLRPGSYMSNFVQYFGPDKEGAIYLPLGDGASSFIDPRDIADVAAAVLTSSGHAGKGYDLTGPEAITIARAAELIGQASGRAIRYIDVPPEAARGAMLGMGAPAWMVDGLLELYAIMKAGYTAATTDNVKKLTGHPARTFADFARDHAAAWKR